MNVAYLVYQAERPRTSTELREESDRAGEFAKALSRVLRFRRHARHDIPERTVCARARAADSIAS